MQERAAYKQQKHDAMLRPIVYQIVDLALFVCFPHPLLFSLFLYIIHYNYYSFSIQKYEYTQRTGKDVMPPPLVSSTYSSIITSHWFPSLRPEMFEKHSCMEKSFHLFHLEFNGMNAFYYISLFHFLPLHHFNSVNLL